MTIGHVAIVVPIGTWEKTLEWYDGTLGAIGYSRQKSFGDVVVGFGEAGKPDLWLFKETETRKPSTSAHVAFNAPDRNSVNAFHEQGVKLGGSDHGAPGIRAHIGPEYFAAFVLDPNGVNIETATLSP